MRIFTRYIGRHKTGFVTAVLCVGEIILWVSLNRQLGFLAIASMVLASILLAASMILSYNRFTLVLRAIDRVNTVVREYLLAVWLVKALRLISIWDAFFFFFIKMMCK